MCDLIERLRSNAASWRRDDALDARDPEAEASLADEAANALASLPTEPVQDGERTPCDIQLPGVKFNRGVLLSTVLMAIRKRAEWDEADTKLPRFTPEQPAKFEQAVEAANAWYSGPQIEEMRRQAGVLNWRDDGDGDLVAVSLECEYHVSSYEGAVHTGGEWKTGWQGYSDGEDIEYFDTLADAINYCQRLSFERALPMLGAGQEKESYCSFCDLHFSTKVCPSCKSTIRADHPAPASPAVGEITGDEKEILTTVQQWHDWAFEWSGSAFMANETSKEATDEECKSALYSDLCKLGNTMAWLHERLAALASCRRAALAEERERP